MTNNCWVSWETFFENHNNFYTCVMESRMGFMGIESVPKRHFNPRNLADQEKSTKQGFPSPTCCTKLLWCPDFMSRSFHYPSWSS